MKITNGTSGAIVASLLLLLNNNEVTARQGQPEEPEQESPSPRKASSKTKMNLRHHNRELRGRSRSSPFPKNNNYYDSYDNREEDVPEAAVPPTPYVRRVLVPQQEKILPYHSTFPWFDIVRLMIIYCYIDIYVQALCWVNYVYRRREFGMGFVK